MSRLELNAQLIKPAKAGDTAVCFSLLDRGADIEAKDELQRTALGWAALFGRTETCLGLLDRGANIEARDDRQRTALGSSALTGRTETCLTLLESGADFFASDQDRKTVLGLAAGNGHSETCLALLAKRADSGGVFTSRAEWQQVRVRTPLEAAAELGRADVMLGVLHSEPDFAGLEDRVAGAISLAQVYNHAKVESVLLSWLAARYAQTALGDLVLTPALSQDCPATTEAWLAASRAVCPNRQLKVLWHGSSTEFATFDDRLGPIWFADDRNVAEVFGHSTYPPPKAAHLAMRHPATDEDLIAHAERLGIEVDDSEPLRTLEFEPELLRSLKEIGRDGSIGAESSTTSCHTVRSWLVGREAQVVLNGLVELKPRCSP